MTFWDGTRFRPDAPMEPRPPVGRQAARVRDLLATTAMLLGLVAIALPFVPASAGATVLSLSPAAGTPGQAVTVSGSGFPAMTRLLVTWDGGSAGMPSAKVSRRGTFTTSFVVPAAPAGSHTVAVTSVSSKSPKRANTFAAPMAAVTFTLTTLLAAPTPTLAGPTAAPSASPSPTSEPTTSPEPSATPVEPAPTPAPTVAPTAPPPPAPATGYVTRCGLGLCLNGVPYRFTGFNIYNANSRDNCWYPLGYNNSALDDALTAVGPGQEAFRAWFYQGLATANGARDWAAFDHTIAVAKAHGVRIIATLADQWGSCDSGPGDAVFKGVSWYTDAYRSAITPGSTKSYRDWVAEIVTRYRDEPTILAWQLMNEAETKVDLASSCAPNGAATLRAWAADVSALVKSIDAHHLVSLGTLGGGQCGTQGGEYASVHDLSTIDLCEYHDYLPDAMPGDQWNGLGVRIAQCAGLGKPIFIGESGQKDLGLAARAARFESKFATQFGAGVAGELVWALRIDSQGGSSTSNYDMGPGDPTVALFGGY